MMTPPTDGPLELKAYSDSSYADDHDTGRTTLGYVIMVNGTTVTASSKLSKRVDSCVNHTELDAFKQAVKEDPQDIADFATDGACDGIARAARDIKWVRGIKAALERRDEDSIEPTPIHVDNAGVLSIIDDDTIKSPKKHIYRTVCECRERVHDEKVAVPVKIHTKDNLANALTKQEPGLRDSATQLRLSTGPPPEQEPRGWMIDSGSSNHITRIG